MKKDQTFYVPFLCLLFLIALIVLGEIPSMTLFGYEIKTIDMFSDIKKEEEPEQISLNIPAIQPKKELQCPEGQICLENYSDNQEVFNTLFSSVNNIQNGEKVRVAFFGDSFIEGDVLCGDFRDLLQHKFGGEGVGYVPITSTVSMFRQTIKEEFKGYKSLDVIHNPKENVPYPPAGECAIPEKDNYALYFPTNFSEKTKLLPGLRIFYQSNQAVDAKVAADANIQKVSLPKGNSIQSVQVDYAASKRVRVSFTENPKTYLYGVSFEGGPGMYVDNYSLRGNSGTALLYSKPEMHRALNKIQDYKLIILQYGTNAINAKTKKLDWYVSMMNKVITELQQEYPQAVILLLSVGDRSYKDKGEYKTMPSVKMMVEAQRAIAAQNKIVFWDMYQAMGGENSMIDFVTIKPRKANLDYTHLNFLGGKDIAELLFKSLMFEYEKYENK